MKRIGINGASVFNLYGRKNVWYKEFDVVKGVEILNLKVRGRTAKPIQLRKLLKD